MFNNCASCSEEEAKKKIYNVSCERYFGFGCEIDEETSNKLEGWCLIFLTWSWFIHCAFNYLLLLWLYFVDPFVYAGLPGVLFVLPDSYVDAENKDYGGKSSKCL